MPGLKINIQHVTSLILGIAQACIEMSKLYAENEGFKKKVAV